MTGTAGDESAEDQVLAITGVTRTFGDVTALDRLTLHVRSGEVVGLLGHNGAGKTTTVRMLAGLLAPDDGTVRVAGRDPLIDGPRVRAGLGVLPARPVVDDRLTAAANLRFVAEVHGLPRDGLTARIDAALVRFGLAERGDERVGTFSTGMRQRLSLARVLLPEPPTLLLDEPTASLDPLAARQVRLALRELADDEGRTVVLCTHDLAEAAGLCDRVIVLEHGRIVGQGSPAALAAEHGTGGVLLEVEPERAGLAAELAREHTVGDIEVDGTGRVRATGLPREAVPALVAALAERSIAVFEVRRLDPTLEEVYLAMHGAGSGRDDAADADGPAWVAEVER